MEKLNEFAWDSATESVDFFGEVEYNPAKVKTEEGAEALEDFEKEPEEDKTPDKKNIKSTEEEVDVFKDLEDTFDNQEEEEEENTIKTKSTNVELNNVGVASFLKEKGFLDFELEEGEELDDDKAALLIENKFEDSIEEKVKELIGDLPDTVKNLVKFAANGGDVDSYISKLRDKGLGTITKDLDLDEEKNQILVVKQRLLAQGEDEDDVEDQIEFLKEKGKLADAAEKHFSKWKKEVEKSEEDLVESQKKIKKQNKENQIKFKSDISKILSEKEEIQNLKFSQSDKKDLPNYISTPSVELEDGRVLTPFYHDLFETLKDKEKTLLLAKLIKSGFDFSDIEKTVKTKQAKEVKENLRRTETSTSKGSSQPKRLVDYFN